MSIDKLLRIKIWSKVLLIVSVILFLIGMPPTCPPRAKSRSSRPTP